jgi:dihydropteroate synthase
MIDDGAQIIDIGGESSRPGAERISTEEELNRVLPVITALVRQHPSVSLSIDTQRASVARTAVEAGCHIVNDISACSDPAMPGIIRDSGATVIVMHMLGEPRTMQVKPAYADVVKEVGAFLAERVDFLRREGIDSDRIVIDPGIGFGKRFRDNLDLLKDIDAQRSVGCRVLVGASRKRFLGEIVDTTAGDRLTGSLAVASWCYQQGVDIVRVHDVKETAHLYRVLDAITNPEGFHADW